MTSNVPEYLKYRVGITDLTEKFFSKDNIRHIQDGIISTVQSASKGKYIIGPQSEKDLKIIMQGIYQKNVFSTVKDHQWDTQATIQNKIYKQYAPKNDPFAPKSDHAAPKRDTAPKKVVYNNEVSPEDRLQRTVGDADGDQLESLNRIVVHDTSTMILYEIQKKINFVEQYNLPVNKRLEMMSRRPIAGQIIDSPKKLNKTVETGQYFW